MIMKMNQRSKQQADVESSESDLSESQEETHNRITMLNQNRKQYLKNNVYQGYPQSYDHQEDDSSSEDPQIYNNDLMKSGSNPRFAQNNFQITRNGQHIKVQEHSDSDGDDSLENDRAYEKRNIGAQYSDDEDDDSSQEEEEFNRYPLAHGIKTVREDSQEDSDDQSIDHIEERIKKLEKDLETRLGKQKKVQAREQTKKASKFRKVGQPKAHPPIPHSKIGTIASKQQVQNENKPNNMNLLPQRVPSHENKINLANESRKMSTQNSKVKKNQSNTNISQKAAQGKKKKNKPKKQINPQSVTQIQSLVKKQKQEIEQETNLTKIETRNEEVGLLMEKINAMEKSMSALETQNKKLRHQLESIQDQDKQSTKPKKKPLEQLQKLKEISKTSQNSKLQKQIELLQVIQKLQSKLKKSINKKLLNNKSASTALLHKGLPSSFLANS